MSCTMPRESEGRERIPHHADIGKAEIDFTPGALVYFVVSFNLQGPVANGITFSPQNPSND